MTEPYSTVDEALDSALRSEDALLIAASLVQRWAPAPDPEPADYADKAAAAERLVFRYIKDTGGYVTGKSLSGVTSKSYQVQQAQLRQTVADTMGDYYTGGAAASVGYIESYG